MTARAIKAINVPRMARVTWYKHRASVLGIPDSSCWPPRC